MQLTGERTCHKAVHQETKVDVDTDDDGRKTTLNGPSYTSKRRRQMEKCSTRCQTWTAPIILSVF